VSVRALLCSVASRSTSGPRTSVSAGEMILSSVPIIRGKLGGQLTAKIRSALCCKTPAGARWATPHRLAVAPAAPR
jgi:hypothetical protein